ncbi:MAG TPA: asparagine synthase (glutamine-hydrolyzing), partial [Chthonomonadales bacterium]|nr:asparagine synthase (glutamine-hydrolyzing) [Chthonomonadales bacterium]
MCGLCGILTPDGAAAQPEFGAAVERMTALMERRGPDDAGAWLSPDGRVRFGFRRLAILDLTAAAHQPMLTADGRYAIVCNGEVYNFRDLRAELERHGCTFRSTGDTEVVLQALVTWGPQALQRFNGMFALAFYDALTKRLLLARDPVGIKPLYYLAVSDHFVFASQYDQLLAHPASRNLSVDPDGLSLYLQLGYIPAPYAALRHTSMVEPGTYVEVDDSGKAQVTRYYEFPQYVRPDLTGDDACDAVHAAVTEAVKRQMVSDVPLGTFLSGGIDSPLVAALMASAASSTVRAYTIGTLGDALDESADASRYAEELGLHHVVEHFAPARAVELLDDVVQACGEPFADYSIFPTMLVARLARREVTVMLSGDGGDELFWGYPGRFGSVVESASAFGEPLWLRSARRAATRYLGVGNTSPNLRMKSIGHWYRAKHSHVPQGWLRRMVPDLPDWPAGCTLFDYTG